MLASQPARVRILPQISLWQGYHTGEWPDEAVLGLGCETCAIKLAAIKMSSLNRDSLMRICIIKFPLFSSHWQSSIRDKYGNTPLHLACAAGDLDCVRALTERITATEEATAISCTGMLVAAAKEVAQKQKKFNRTHLVQYADVELRNYDGEWLISGRGGSTIRKESVDHYFGRAEKTMKAFL